MGDELAKRIEDAIAAFVRIPPPVYIPLRVVECIELAVKNGKYGPVEVKMNPEECGTMEYEDVYRIIKENFPGALVRFERWADIETGRQMIISVNFTG